MKKIFFSLFALLPGSLLHAQIGLGFPNAAQKVSQERLPIAYYSSVKGPQEKAEQGNTLIGLCAGGSFATNLYDYGTFGGEPTASFLPLPTAGFTFDFESKGSFSFLIGLYLKGKGDKINMADYVADWTFPQEADNTIRAEATGSVTTSVYWFEFPLVFAFNFGRPNRVQFGFGPYAAYGLMGKEKSDFTITYYLNEELLTEETVNEEKDLTLANFIVETETEGERYINRVDYGLFLLLGFKFPPFAITATSSIGFANQIPFKGSDLFSAGKIEKTVRSFTPSLTLTYFFKN